MVGKRSASITGHPLRLAALCVMALGLGGCATTQSALRLEQSHRNAPIRLLVMESPMSVDEHRLRTVLTPDIKPGLPATAVLIAQAESHAQKYALASMESALGKQSWLELIAPATEERRAIDKVRGRTFERAITQEDADRLRASTGADALLRFSITDYGLTPRAWRKGYIAFEVASTLGIAGAIAYSGSAAARAAAGVYLTQETVEETAEAYAGFWALDVVCRPVRVEAELVRLHPVGTVWETSATGLSDVALSRIARKVAWSERDGQLDQATNEAVSDVVSDLADVVARTKFDSIRRQIE